MPPVANERSENRPPNPRDPRLAPEEDDVIVVADIRDPSNTRTVNSDSSIFGSDSSSSESDPQDSDPEEEEIEVIELDPPVLPPPPPAVLHPAQVVQPTSFRPTSFTQSNGTVVVFGPNTSRAWEYHPNNLLSEYSSKYKFSLNQQQYLTDHLDRQNHLHRNHLGAYSHPN